MATEGTQPFADFEQNLNDWLARTGEAPVPPPSPRIEPALPRLFDERLQRLQTYLDQAERDAEQALTPLADDIQALRQWLDALSRGRAKLVERTVRGA